jgi:hypothetical protein
MRETHTLRIQISLIDLIGRIFSNTTQRNEASEIGAHIFLFYFFGYGRDLLF